MLLAPTQGAGAACVFLPVTSWYDTILAGGYKLPFEDHYPPGPHGYTWVSSRNLKIIHPDGTSCSESDDVSIVTLPLYIAAKHYLYINTYGDGSSNLFVVDARDCKTLWQSPDMGGYMSVRTVSGFKLPNVGWLKVKPDCLPGKISSRPSAILPVPLETGEAPD
jgi:hypothetical protein